MKNSEDTTALVGVNDKDYTCIVVSEKALSKSPPPQHIIDTMNRVIMTGR